MSQKATRIAAVLVLAVAVVVGLYWGARLTGGVTRSGSSARDEQPADTSELVHVSDAIITGTVLSHQFVGHTSGYNGSGQLVIVDTPAPNPGGPTPDPLASPDFSALPAVDFVVRADNVLLNDGGSVTPGANVIVRMIMGSEIPGPCWVWRKSVDGGSGSKGKGHLFDGAVRCMG